MAVSNLLEKASTRSDSGLLGGGWDRGLKMASQDGGFDGGNTKSTFGFVSMSVYNGDVKRQTKSRTSRGK